MANKRKVVKKSAKKTSIRKTSATTAKTKPAASRRAARAKTKITKPKVPARRRTEEDPCQRQRDARERVRKEISEIEAALSESDIPVDVRKELEARLRQKQGRLRFLQQQLDQCEAKHRP